MKRIISSEMVSLDGFFAGPKGEIDWFVWNKETSDFAVELAKSIDTMLFGRTTYEGMAAYWPNAKPSENDQAIIDKMNDTAKIVFSKSLKSADWKNTSIVNEIELESIMQMKNEPGKDMVVYGSGSVLATLCEMGLVDEHYIFVNPVILGGGKPLFAPGGRRQRMRLLDTRTFSSGVVLLHYATS